MTEELQIKLTADLSGFTKGLDKAMRSVDKMGQKLTKAGKTMSVAFTAPLVGFTTLSVKTFIGFDDQMRKVGAIAGATSTELSQLRETALEMGRTTRFSASQAAQGLEFMALAGFDTQQSINALPGVLSLAAAAAMDLGIASEIVTDTMSAFKIEASEAGQVADVFAKLQSIANTNVEQAGAAFSMAAPNARAFGQSLEQTSAMLGIFADAGIKGTRAGTTLNGIFRDLTNGAENNRVELNGASIALTDQNGEYRSIIDVMADFENALQGLSSSQKTNALGAIFQEEAIKGVNIIMGTGVSRLNELEAALNNSEGASKKMAEEMESGLGGAMRNLRSSVEGLMIQLGDLLAPTIQSISEFLKEAAISFQELDESTRTIIAVFGALLAALGPLLVGFGFMATTILPQLVAGLALIASPIGLLVISLGALAAGLAVFDSLVAKSNVTYIKTAAAVEQLDAAYKELSKIQTELEGLQKNGIDLSKEQIEAKKQETIAVIRNTEALLKEQKLRQESLMESIKLEMNAMQQSKLGGGAQVGRIKALSENLELLKKSTSQTELQIFRLAQTLFDLENSNKNVSDSASEAGQTISEALSRPNATIEVTRKGVVGVKNELKKLSEASQAIREPITTTFTNLGTHIDFLAEGVRNLIYSVGQGLTGAFQQVLDGSASPLEAIGQMIRQLITRLIAAAAAAAVLSVILGAIGIGGAGFGALFGQFSGLGSFAGGGSGSIGQNVSLGSGVTGATGATGGAQPIQIFGRLQGSDIVLSNERGLNDRNRQRGF